MTHLKPLQLGKLLIWKGMHSSYYNNTMYNHVLVVVD